MSFEASSQYKPIQTKHHVISACVLQCSQDQPDSLLQEDRISGFSTVASQQPTWSRHLTSSCRWPLQRPATADPSPSSLSATRAASSSTVARSASTGRPRTSPAAMEHTQPLPALVHHCSPSSDVRAAAFKHGGVDGRCWAPQSHASCEVFDEGEAEHWCMQACRYMHGVACMVPATAHDSAPRLAAGCVAHPAQHTATSQGTASVNHISYTVP